MGLESRFLKMVKTNFTGRLGGERAAAVFPNWDIEYEHFESSTDLNIIIASRHRRNDFHNAKTTAIELLEVNITAYEAAESRNKVTVNTAQLKSCVKPNLTDFNDHTWRASQ